MIAHQYIPSVLRHSVMVWKQRCLAVANYPDRLSDLDDQSLSNHLDLGDFSMSSRWMNWAMAFKIKVCFFFFSPTAFEGNVTSLSATRLAFFSNSLTKTAETACQGFLRGRLERIGPWMFPRLSKRDAGAAFVPWGVLHLVRRPFSVERFWLPPRCCGLSAV